MTKLTHILLAFLISSQAFAQSSRFGNINVTGSAAIGTSATANSKAVLDLTSTTKGMLPPRMTTVQRDAISSPPEGLTIYNTTTDQLNHFDGTNWVGIPAQSGNVNKYLKTDGSAMSWATVVSGGGFDQTNQLANGDAELGATTSWTNSGGTFAVTSTASNVFDGTYSFSFDASAGSQYAQQSIAVPEGLKGRNCLLYVPYKGGDANLAIKVTDGTNTLGSQTLAAATTYQVAEVSFTCPTSGNIVARIESSADAAIAYFEAYLGKNFKLGTVQNVTAWQSYTPTFTGFGTVASSSMFWRRVGDTMEIQGYFTIGTPTATTANFTLPNSATIGSTDKIGAANWTPAGRWTNNRSTASVYKGGNILMANGYQVLYFGLESEANAVDSLSFRNGDSFSAAGNTIMVNARGIPITGWGAETALRLDQTPASWSGYHSSGCQWSTGSTSYVDVTDAAGCSIYELFNRNMGAVSSDGVTATTGGASGTLGMKLTWTPRATGRYEVCANGNHAVSSAGGGNLQMLDDGSQINELSHEIPAGLVNNFQPWSLCGIANASSTSSAKTVKIQMKNPSGAGNYVVNIGTGKIFWTIKHLDAPSAMPVIVGTVATNSSGQIRTEYAHITDPGTITQQSGTWISSVSRPSTGNFTVNLVAGMFSSAPVCTCSGYNNFVACMFSGTSTSAVNVVTRDLTGANALYNGNFYLSCQGAK
jgi:hypothetical protein